MIILTAYVLLTKTTFFCQVHPRNLVIPTAATCHAQEELKCQYDENLRVFHETRGVEQALIKKLILTFEARYIMAMNNSITRQFTGNNSMLNILEQSQWNNIWVHLTRGSTNIMMPNIDHKINLILQTKKYCC